MKEMLYVQWYDEGKTQSRPMKEKFVQWYDEGSHTITIGEGKERRQGKTQSKPMKENSVQWYDEGWHTITIGEVKKRLEGKTQSRPMKEMKYSAHILQLILQYTETTKVGITIKIGEGKIVLFIGDFLASCGKLRQVVTSCGKFKRGFRQVLGLGRVWASSAASYFKTASF